MFVLILAIFALTHISSLKLNNVNALPALILGCLIFLATTSIFPWFLFNKSPFNLIQFPFRLTIFCTFYLLLAGTIALTHTLVSTELSLSSLSVIVVSILLVIGSYATTNKSITDRASEKVAIVPQNNNQTFNLKEYTYATIDDYRPAHLSTPQRKSIVKKQFSINHETYNNSIKLVAHSNYLSFNYSSNNKPATIDTPVVDYKGISVFDNDSPITTTRSERGTIQLKLSGKMNHRIIIQYTGTWLRKISFWLSTISFLISIIWLIYRQLVINHCFLNDRTVDH